jgi:hypothetical protein
MTSLRVLNKGDEDIQDLIDDAKKKYIDKGWRVLVAVFNIILGVNLLIIHLFSDHYEVKYRARFILIFFVSFLYAAKIICINYEFLGKYMFCLFIIILGIFVSSGSLKKDNYSFYEMWLTYLSSVYLFNSFMCLQFKYLAIPHLISMVYILVRTTIKYEDVPPPFYATIV